MQLFRSFPTTRRGNWLHLQIRRKEKKYLKGIQQYLINRICCCLQIISRKYVCGKTRSSGAIMTLVCRLWSSADNTSERNNFGWKQAAANANSQRRRHFLLNSKTKLSKFCFSHFFSFFACPDLWIWHSSADVWNSRHCIRTGEWLPVIFFFSFLGGRAGERSFRSDCCAEPLIAHGFGVRLQCDLAFTWCTAKKMTFGSKCSLD